MTKTRILLIEDNKVLLDALIAMLSEQAERREFLRTVRSVARGEKILPPSLADSLFSHLVSLSPRIVKGEGLSAARVTKREREIIVLIADGLSNKEMAQRLNLATHTVKTHVHNIMEKLALHSRLQIAKFKHDDSS